MQSYDAIIIGGGLAGLTAGIELALAGYEVAILEKGNFPRHKVCGEYVSNEVLPYLGRLGVFPLKEGAKHINKLEISSPSGRSIGCKMEMGGFGISRFVFDDQMVRRAVEVGAIVQTNAEVDSVRYEQGAFVVATRNGGELKAKQVVGAFGKRSKLDRKLGRPFFFNRSEYVGVKHHFEGNYPVDKVALHNFEGGYCGLSKVENDWVNVCYLTTAKQLARYDSLEAFETKHLARNPHLCEFFSQSTSCYDPLVISQVSFAPKQPVEDHILMCGDAAGLISPLCGNGMAMAITAGKLCAESVRHFLAGKISRPEMESNYSKSWKRTFASRLAFGRRVQRLFGHPAISEFSMHAIRLLPGLLPHLVKRAHGNKIL